MNHATLTFALAALAGHAPAAQELVPPEVGEIAPPIGNVRWLQVGDEDSGRPPQLGSLRGHVVVVQTYGHYCDP